MSALDPPKSKSKSARVSAAVRPDEYEMTPFGRRKVRGKASIVGSWLYIFLAVPVFFVYRRLRAGKRPVSAARNEDGSDSAAKSGRGK